MNLIFFGSGAFGLPTLEALAGTHRILAVVTQPDRPAGERMGAGLVLGQDSMPVDMRVTAGELHDQLAARGPALMQSVLAQMQAGTLKGQAQDESLVTKARKLSKADAWIDFSDSAEH